MNRNLIHLATVVSVAALLSAAAARAQPARVTAIVERTFGASTHPDSLLQGVADLARGSDGRVFVLDLARNLKAFDSTGVLRRIIGRAGAGPGEFGIPVKLEIAPDGRIFVVELGRVQSFSPNGTLLASFKVVPAGETPLGFSASNDGVLHMATGLFTTPMSLAPRDSAAVTALVRGGRPQALQDSLIRVRSWKSNGDSASLLLSTGAAPSPVLNLMPTSLWSRNGAGTMIVSSGAKPSFRFYSPAGRFLREIGAPASWRATPLPGSEVEFLLAKIAEPLPAESRDRSASFLRRVGFASAYPAYVRLILADDESIWAQPPATAADIRSGRVKTYNLNEKVGLPEWHVYSSAGVLRMLVALPEGFNLRRIAGTRLYGETLNADGEPVVQILRVPLPR